MGGERGEETDEGKTLDNWEHPGPSAEGKVAAGLHLTTQVF